MQKILCFGDSNVYGYTPATGARYNVDERWSGILKQRFQKFNYDFIEAGCNNRTCFINNQTIDTTGYKIFPSYLANDDYDCIIISLGINDLQKDFSPSELEIAKGLERLIKQALERQPLADIVVLCPSQLNHNILNGYFKFLFDQNSIKKSKMLPAIYERVCADLECYFVDLNKYTPASNIDGLHYTKEQHKIIADNLYFYLKNLMGAFDEEDFDF